MSFRTVRYLSKTCAVLAKLTVSARSNAVVLSEHLGQMALAGKACLDGDLSRRQAGLLEQAPGLLKPLMQQEMVWAFASSLTEQPGEVIRAVASLARECVKGQIISQMGLDEIQHSCHLAMSQSS